MMSPFVTCCHFLSLLITFCHFWNNFLEVSQACFVHTNASASHHDTIVLCIQTEFLQKYLFKTTKRCECSLFITFCHFLSLSVTFGPTFGMCHKPVFCTPMPLHGIVTLHSNCFLSKPLLILQGVKAHFLSLFITFCHFWTNLWNVSQACFLHTNASAWHCDTAFKLFFYQNLC